MYPFLLVPFHEDQQLCEAWHLKNRYAEEMIQSQKELKQFLKTIVQLRSKLEEKFISIVSVTSDERDEFLEGAANLVNLKILHLNELLCCSLHLLRSIIEQERVGLSDEELLHALFDAGDTKEDSCLPPADEDDDFDDDASDALSYSTTSTDEESEEGYDDDETSINEEEEIDDNLDDDYEYSVNY